MLMIFLLNIVTELRILKRIVGETVKGVTRAKLVNVVIVGTMAAILTIFGCLLRTSLGISNFISELGNTLEVSAYVKSGYNPYHLSKQIVNYAHVKQVNIITKEESWHKLKTQMEVPNIHNPLPDTLRIKISDQKYIPVAVQQIKTTTGIEDVQYANELAAKMQKINDFANMATLIVIVFLGGLTLFIINNTIHLVIESRKQEIEIMRMMGVSNWYIKAPYVLQGASYGLMGALISFIPLNFLQSSLSKFFGFFQISSPIFQNNVVILSVLVIGVLMGAVGSIISVRKYLKI